jgi:hypothetical protein
MKRTLASRKEIARITDERLNREFSERMSGHAGAGTFDLEDISRLGLRELTEPLLGDIKKVILWADEKRSMVEDYRALRRNRNDWLILMVSVCIGVLIPFVISGIAVWVLNGITLAPQSVLLAIKTMRRY